MLPPASDEQIYVTVSPISGGKITLPERFFTEPADQHAYHTVPSLAFHIIHPVPNCHPHRIMFDLGLRSSVTNYSEPQQQHLQNRKPYTVGPGVAEALRQEKIDASDIDIVILSHVHYDHHGDPEHFPKAKFLVGPGTLHLLEHGLPSTSSHQHFAKDLLPRDQTVELPEISEANSDYKWDTMGSFSSIDVFGDGSIYVLNSPGHLPGHINLLCRVSAGKWVCLCGDAYHDRRLLTGERDIAYWTGQDGSVCCIHNDPNAARQALGQLRELAATGDVELIGAHDALWYAANSDRMFPASL
ncbi:Uncharacterized protein TPAR_05579 [Tolypocladium paradoxum]|uniref:Metallo-beta-lactamase domain-containing protein n=1 Tax=Tolypocladium paradoxum TaxID=94208 RepID=A0A2S4KVK8_9HYPO|nr:Uncharacterized protein TPAR_05579 [Tolypocladium paradoxum]